MNKIFLIGNLSRENDLRHSNSGMAILKNSVAINSKVNGQEVCDFHDFTCFGKTAEVVEKHTAKGSKILIEGRLTIEKWQDKESGANRQKTSIIADRIQFLSEPKSKGNQQIRREEPSQPAFQPPPRAFEPPPMPANSVIIDDDDIPF